MIEPRLERMRPGTRPLIIETTKRVELVEDPAAMTLLRPPPAFAPPSKRASNPDGLEANLLTGTERAAWILRNRRTRLIEDLGLAGFAIGSPPDGRAYPPSRISVSAPVYTTEDSAILYVDYRCGGTCGEGLLVRLIRGGREWRVIAETSLWIS